MNNKIIYGIIILCIVFTILIGASVLSTGYKIADFLLALFLSAIGLYLMYKNIETAKVAPDPNPNSSSGIVDNENLDPEISNKIATYRDYDVNKNNENSEGNLNNNEQQIIQIQNVQEQRDLDIKREREIKQALILEIINKNQNNIDKIPSLIINEIFNTNYDFDFFTEYQSKYLIPIQNEDNKNTIDYIISILSLYNKLTDIDKYTYRNTEDDKIREKIINNSKNQKIPEHIKSVVPTEAKLHDKVTSKFIQDVQENQENNYKLNNIITNYINYLQTQTINVMNLFRQNVEKHIQDEKLWNIIWQKAWMADNFNDPDRDPNSLGTGDR